MCLRNVLESIYFPDSQRNPDKNINYHWYRILIYKALIHVILITLIEIGSIEVIISTS